MRGTDSSREEARLPVIDPQSEDPQTPPRSPSASPSCCPPQPGALATKRWGGGGTIPNTMCIYKAASEGFHLGATATETVSDACRYKLTWEFPAPPTRSGELPTIDDPDPPPTDAATLLFCSDASNQE